MEIKTTVRCNHTHTVRTIIKQTENTKYWQGCGNAKTLMHCWSECTNPTATLENSLAVSLKS